MVGASFGLGLGGGWSDIRMAHDRDVVLMRGQRAQDGRGLEIAALLGGRPVMLPRSIARAARGAVHHLECDEAGSRVGCALARSRERGNHRVEKRQRHPYAESAKRHAPRNVLLGNEHYCVLYISYELTGARHRQRRRVSPSVSSGTACFLRYRERMTRTGRPAPSLLWRWRAPPACRSAE